MSSIFVRIEDIPKTPEAFQQYVRDWFRPQVILGFVCMTAIQELSVDHTHYRRIGTGLGKAPSHSVDLGVYQAGLHGTNLCDWIYDNTGSLVWVMH